MSNEKNPIGGQNSVSGKKSRRVPRVSEQPGQIFQDQDLTEEDYREMFGTETVSGALGVLFGALEATVGDAQNHRQLMVSLGAETKPTSILEAMLLTQIFTVHISVTQLAYQMNSAKSVEVKSAISKALNDSAKTFSKLLERLDKHRSKASQTVRIEHITIQEGGQAIVGNVNSKGRGSNEI